LPFKNKIKFKRAFVFIFSIVASLFFIIIGHGLSSALSNYSVDVKAANLLVENSSVYFTSIRNEAVFMENLINAQTNSPYTVVIGSSRIMQVRSFNERKLLNLGISGSSLRDDIGMIYLVDKKLNPSILLIGADPWLFHAKLFDGRHEILEIAYDMSVGKPQMENTVDSKDSKLTFINKKIQNFYERTTYSLRIPENDLPEFKSKKRNDGSQVYGTDYISKSQNEIEAAFNDLIKYREFGMLNTSIDEFSELLEKQLHKRKVVLVLSPYHPKLYERMKKELPILLDIENEFRKIAKKKNIQIIGSYDPGVVGCVAGEFYDGMHPGDFCMRKIVSNIEKDVVLNL
jgi:hypothetical protein